MSKGSDAITPEKRVSITPTITQEAHLRHDKVREIQVKSRKLLNEENFHAQFVNFDGLLTRLSLIIDYSMPATVLIPHIIVRPPLWRQNDNTHWSILDPKARIQRHDEGS